MDAPDHLGSVARSFEMEGDEVGPRLDVVIDDIVGIRHHEVRVDGKRGAGFDLLQDARTEREVGNEMAVHDIVVHPIRGRDGVEIGAEPHEVGGQDGRCDGDRLGHDTAPFLE